MPDYRQRPRRIHGRHLYVACDHVPAPDVDLDGPFQMQISQLDMLKEIRESGDVNAYLQEKLDSKEKIMGFGHRVYKKQDPREIFLRDMAKKLTEGTENEEFFNMSQEIEEFMKDKKGLIPNVDFYSATVYHTLGIDSDIFTLIFAMSRVAGWIAHIQEQQKNNKLIRPRSQYIGQENMTYIPLEKRQGGKLYGRKNRNEKWTASSF